MTINEILDSFEKYDGVYKRQEVDAAIALQDEITPQLINVLKDVLVDPEKYADEENNYFGHIYAFMLLGYFREVEAHDVIVGLFSLPGKLSGDLFGDCVTGNLPIVLLNTCGGDLTRIKELVLNQDADEYCRGSAIESVMYGVIEGIISREDVLSYYSDLFAEYEKAGESSLTATLACCVCDLYPEELMPVIDKAYDVGIVDSTYISREEFDEALAKGKNKCLQELYVKFDRIHSLSVHDSMSWWASFDQDKKAGNILSTSSTENRSKLNLASTGHVAKKIKSKNKIAKKSRKANRKKRK